MNTNMYENPIVQENIEKLKSLGYQFIEPKESMLACGTLGKGALADVDVIVDIVEGSIVNDQYSSTRGSKNIKTAAQAVIRELLKIRDFMCRIRSRRFQRK